MEGRVLLPGDLSKVMGKRVEGASSAYGSHGLSLLWEHDDMVTERCRGEG